MTSTRLRRLGIALERQDIRNCEKCAGIIPEFQRGSLYRFKVQDLVDSAITGCPLCNLILDGVVAVNTNSPLSSISEIGLVRARQLMGVHITSDGTPVYGKPNFSLVPLVELYDYVRGLPERVENSTSSETCIKLVKDWMKKCVESHPSCTVQSPYPKWMPTRLLDISQVFADEGNVRLVESNEHNISEPYACLSHCWGGRQPILLNTSSQSRLRSGVGVSEFPRTFYDAMRVASWMDIRYLWIDSLCIFQDSEEDWLTEASRMGKNYRNATITIAATDATDCDAGLFRKRLPGITVMPVVKAFQVRSLAEKEAQVVGVLNTMLWRDSVDSAPLNTRAWVLQERVLSSRILHFGKNQIFWECTTANACETFAETLPPSVEREAEMNLLAFVEVEGREKIALNRYYRICEAYSKGRLTYLSDKIVAFSGVANEISILTTWQYLAGLWRPNFEAQLLWTVASPSNAQRPEVYRAPSWSWLSIDGEIKKPAYLDEPKVVLDIIIVVIDPQRLDFPTGNIERGYIEARGLIKRFSFDNLGQNEVWILDDDRQHMRNDALTDIGLIWDMNPLCAALDVSKEYYLLPVFIQGGGFTEPIIRGLIVSPAEAYATHETQKSYFRLGVFEAQGSAVCRLVVHRECRGQGCKFPKLTTSFYDSHQSRMEDLRDQYARIRAEAEPLQGTAKRIKAQQEDSMMSSLAANIQTLRII